MFIHMLVGRNFMKLKGFKKGLLIGALSLTTVGAPLIAPIANSIPVIAAETAFTGFKTEGSIAQYYKDGKKSTATGFVKGSGTNYWYIKNGKVDYKTTGFISGTVNGTSGSYYVYKNKVKGIASQVDTKNWYEIVPTHNTNFRVDVDGANPATGANIFLYTKNGTIAQKFKFVGAGNGYYYITTATSGGTKALDSGAYKGVVGYQNVLTTGNKYLKWKPVKYSNGAYGFYNEQKGIWLDVAGDGKYVNKRNIQVYDYIDGANNRGAEGQEFKLVSTKLTGFAKESGKWVYYKNGTKLSGTDIVEGVINGTKGWYYIKNGVYTSVNSVEKNSHGWWYLKNGKVDFNYTGFAKNSNGWWWIEKGKVTFNKTGFETGTINNKKATYYVINSKATGTLVNAPMANQWVEVHLSEDGNRMLDVLNAKADNGTNIQLCHRTNSAKAQSYMFKSVGNYYYNIYTGTENLKKVLDVSNSQKDGNVIQYTRHNGANQQWRFVKNFGSKGDYRIINRATGQSLTVANNSSNVYSGRSDDAADGKGRQKWTINKGATPTWSVAKPATSTSTNTTANTAKQAFSDPDNQDATVGSYVNNGNYSITHYNANGLYYTKATGTEPQLTITGGNFNAHSMANSVGAKAAIDAGMGYGNGNFYSYGKMWTNYRGNNEGNTLVLRTNGYLDSCHVNSGNVGRLGLRWAVKGLITLTYNGTNPGYINSDGTSSCWSFIVQDYSGAYYIGSTPSNMTKTALRNKLHATIPNIRFAYATEGGGHVKYIRNGNLIVNGHGQTSRTTPGLIWFK